MADRITEKHLQAVVDRLNKLTGSPAQPWAPDAEGKHRAQVGNFHLSFACGGVCVHRMHNTSGGVTTPLLSYHTTRRETYNALQAFISGIEFAQDKPEAPAQSARAEWLSRIPPAQAPTLSF